MEENNTDVLPANRIYKSRIFAMLFSGGVIPLFMVVSKLRLINTIWALVLPGAVPVFNVILLINFFKGVPESLDEAARIDGASWPQVFFKIMMPMCKPIFITAGLMIFMGEWNSYMWPLLVARSVRIRTVQIMLAVVKMEHITLWSCMYAGAVLSVMIPVLIFLPLQKYYVSGITAGAVKG